MNRISKHLEFGFLWFFVLVIFTSFCLAGEDSAAAVKKDPCSYLTKEEIQEIIGKSVSDGKVNAKANPILGPPCDYTVGDYGVFSLWIGQNQTNTCEKTMAELNQRNIKTAPAAGIGECSFFADQGYGMLQLNTWQGTNYVIITLMIPGENESQQKSIAEKLMRLVINKL